MMPNTTSNQLVGKLSSFNWEADKPRVWPCCKLALQITGYCISISFFIMICVAVVYGEKSIGLLIFFLIMHFFACIITVGVLGDVSFILAVLAKIEPDSDIFLEIERVKRKHIIYGLRTGLIAIAISVLANLFFISYSGVLMALSGGVFSCLFYYKVGKLIPAEFRFIVSKHMPGGGRLSQNDTSLPSRRINPATGLPMLNKSIDVAGNGFGSRSRR